MTRQEKDRQNELMVDDLVRRGAIRDARVERAFRAVRRHWFLPTVNASDVYVDRAVVTHRDDRGVAISSSSQPALMARMLEQLSVEPGMAVLEVGTGTGYNAALLGRLVGPEGTVLTVDLDAAIAGAARGHLAAAVASNVTVVAGDGWAPMGTIFDRIEVTVGVSDLSPAWVEKLAPDGVLVAPLWLRAGQQASFAFRRVAGGLESASVEPCGFMRIRGAGAGGPTYQRVGAWTVSLDGPSPDEVRVLGDLLASGSSLRPAPPLERGWFTPIALGEPDAVHLFSEGTEGPVIWTGVLSVSPPGLAVVETEPRRETIRSFGSEEPLARLLDLIDQAPAVDPSHLAVSAVPAGGEVEAGDALATLARPNFTFVVRSG